jgi:cell volume regulation protein A
MDANIIVMLISLTLFLAYISGILYTKTGVPDNLWLIGFGILFGPVTKIFDFSAMITLIPFVVLMALNLLMFEAGLNVDMKTFRESMQKSGYLGLVTYILTVFSVGYVLSFFMPSVFTFTEGLLFGAMIGGTSTSTVLSLLGCIGLNSSDLGECKLFLVLESIFTDSISIVTTMTLLRILQMPGIPLTEGFKDIAFVLMVGIFVGFGIGVIWVQLLDLARNRPFNYIMTLAILFVCYFIGEQLGGPGTGALSGLVFGVTMTNYPLLAKRFNLKENVRVERKRLRAFHEEITFLIKSFMFFFVGLQLNLSLPLFAVGIVLAALIGFIRFIAVSVTTYFTPLSDVEVKVARLEFSNGLTALVLAQLPYLVEGSSFFTDAGIYLDLISPIVITTALFGALLGPLIYKNQIQILPEMEIESLDVGLKKD